MSLDRHLEPEWVNDYDLPDDDPDPDAERDRREAEAIEDYNHWVGEQMGWDE